MNAADFPGAARLAGRCVGALTRIAVDRAEETVGAALPRTPAQLAEPGVVSRLLTRCAPAGAPALPALTGARLSGVRFESSNCTNFLVEVEFAGGPPGDADTAPGDRVIAAPPRTLYAKLPCPELATRVFARAIGFWDVEATFCERVAPHLPIRVPRVHAVARRGARFVLLLEDLTASPDVRLFINRDMAKGTTPERAAMCLRTFAELHAAFWDRSPAEREALLPTRLHPYLGPGGRGVTRALNAAAIRPAHAAAPDLFGAAHAALCERAIAKWDALVDAWYAGPLTLIHGDSHLANCFEYASPSGPRMGLLDFQGAQWGQGLRDVQYHLIDSLEPDVLAEAEAELVDGYLRDLAGFGVAFDAARARDQYRALAFQTLMVAVVSLGLGSLTERDETVRSVLRRSVAAIDRLDFAGWLDAL